jgi:hypothetical protein
MTSAQWPTSASRLRRIPYRSQSETISERS